ncbi:Breast cancer 2, early onset [Mortierella sp. AM989]|nr:Breast cancer 2, early onset [Mortierella sp. AM989]
MEPMTPPALRYRGMSLDPETPPGHSPIPFDRSIWASFDTRGPHQTGGNINNADSPTEHILEATNVPSSVRRHSRSVMPKLIGAEYLGTEQRIPSTRREQMVADSAQKTTPPYDTISAWKTPTRRAERRLSMSSLSTKSPSSTSATNQPLLYRRHSFIEPDSPSIQTPTMTWRRNGQPTLSSDDSVSTGPASSLLNSPSAAIQWSQSLETPVKRPVGPGESSVTPTNNIIQRLRGLQPLGSMDESATAVEGWSAILETPPRNISKDQGPKLESKISGGVLDSLRGNPRIVPLLRAKASQDKSFNSASSSIVSDTDDYQGELRGEGYGNSNNESAQKNGVAYFPTQERRRSNSASTIEFDPRLDDNSLEISFLSQSTDVGLTLPSSLVHKLEQESLSMESQVFQSQIFPDSQSDASDVIPSFEFNTSIVGKSNFASRRPSKSDADLNDGSISIYEDLPMASQGPDQVQMTEFSTPPANILGATQMFASQDLGTNDMRIESWAASLQHEEEQRDIHQDINQDIRNSPELCHGREPIELLSEDDFGNIRFSQLDDGFNVIPEATQKPHKRSPVVSKAIDTYTQSGDAAWVSTSASMLGDLDIESNRVSFQYTDNREAQSSFMSGGFSTAGGKKLAPMSKAALARVANLFDEDDGPGPNTGLKSSKLMADGSANVGTSKSFTGFQTAGKKALLPISDAARAKVAFLFEDDDLDIDASNPSPNRRTSAPPQLVISDEAESIEIQSLQFGGFTSGGGKKLAAISKDVLDKRSNRFAEDDDSHLVMSRSVAEPRKPTILPLAPQNHPAVFSGFSSGAGKALAPISKAAQDRALSFLELNEPSIPAPVAQRTLLNQSLGDSNNGGNSIIDSKLPLAVSGSRISNATIQQPAISSHMSNLKLKSIRATTTGLSSLPGIMKPLLKSRTSFKSPLAFKPPVKKITDTQGGSGTPNNIPSINYSSNGTSINASSRGGTLLSKHSTLAKTQTNKRSTLHPNARPALSEPPILTSTQPTKINSTTPSYTPLFNLQSDEKKPNLHNVLSSPRRRGAEELLSLEVPEDAIKMTLESARSYRFGDWGVEEACHDLVSRGATPHLLSKVWLENHYGLVVWKLACYVRSWPEHFMPSKVSPSSLHINTSWFSPTMVLDQIAYRFEREINRAERPALRKIVEGDESAAKHMVLCVSSITREHSEEIKQGIWKVTVTDGWYILPATLDACLIRALERGKKFVVGSKLHVCRAKLNGAENGVAILELAGAGASTSSVSIVLQANGTKLARWDAKLGFQRSPLIWTRDIRSILPEGGLVPGLDAVVLRKYPLFYLETLEDGTTKIKRTAREEERAVEAHREQIQKQYQDIVQQVEREFGSGDCEADPGLIQEQIQKRAGELLQNGAYTRNVTPFFTIRVGNYLGGGMERDAYDDNDAKGGGGQRQEALVTFWHSDHSLYQEGHRVRMTSLIAKKAGRETGFEDILQLVGTRMSTVREMPTDPEILLLTNYHPREITLCHDIGYLYQGAEIDIAVIILAVSEVVVNSNKIYFIAADTSTQLILVEHQLSPTSLSSLSSSDDQLPSFLKVQSRILMANARFKLRDHKLGLDIVSSLQSYTQVTAAPPMSNMGASASVQPSGVSGWPTYAQSSLQRLNGLFAGISNNNKEKGETILGLMAKANTILESMRPSF